VNYICIHGHFYQPPRENPWLEDIEVQDSAYPYHDWNERITAECYAPNAASRIMDSLGKITKIPNNYSKISFNFGPTLLAWLEQKAPEVYANILLADQISQRRYAGHGSALAQCYNHMIMPLAHPRDKYTQVLWGIKDFQHRFQRNPEGMWLPETAVDLETLDIMADLGIKFTILAPRQASRVRSLYRGDWHDVSGEHIDPTRAYLQRLPSGRSMALFFYDGPISKAVAFEGLLDRGEYLAGRLLSATSDQRHWPQLIHIATDGETFGHHHKQGEMALSYALDFIKSQPGIKLTNYGQYLAKHPPAMEVEIFENSSWSCVHGVERWQRDCGCNSGMHSGWHQGWRQPLRDALDWLRDNLALQYEKKAADWFPDPWAARDGYIEVIQNRSFDTIQSFLDRYSLGQVEQQEWTILLRLLEIQRSAMLMYTSCGWFFDELSGLETVQVFQYAGRALQMAQEIFPDSLEEGFLQRLELARSNIPEHEDGRQIYAKFVKPATIDLLEVGAHYAISSIFEEYGECDSIFCYDICREDYRRSEAGKATLVIGEIQVASKITHNSGLISFAVLHLGDHNIYGGVRFFQGQEAFDAMAWEVTEVFAGADFLETISCLDRHFGAFTYSLRSLFRDEQRKVLNQIMACSLQEVGSAYQQIYKYHVPLMRFITDLGAPMPKGYLATAELVINLNLRQAFEAEEPNLEFIFGLLEEAHLFHIEIDSETLEFALRQTLQRLAIAFSQEPANLERLIHLAAVVELAKNLPFEVNLWTVQNICYTLLHRVYPEQKWLAQQGNPESQVWLEHFQSLIRKLDLAIPAS
jgi:alpha-amylase/alpha-mannosidase (GH57 family)